jgi:hypothetical protein
VHVGNGLGQDRALALLLTRTARKGRDHGPRACNQFRRLRRDRSNDCRSFHLSPTGVSAAACQRRLPSGYRWGRMVRNPVAGDLLI